MSSNGPPRNYYGVLKTNLKTCAKRTKLRVYSVTKVKTMNMRKSLSHKTCLVMLNGPIRSKFGFENPATAYYIVIVRTRYKNPRIICLQILNLIIHSREPFRVFCSRLKTLRFFESKKCLKSLKRRQNIHSMI